MPRSQTPAWRLAIAYVAFFAHGGIWMPYWPLWLQDQGVSAGQLGLLLALPAWARMLANPAVALSIGSRGLQRWLVVLIGLLFAGGHWGFALSTQFSWLILCTTIVGVASAPYSGLLDAMTMVAAQRGELRYGRLRSLGSLSFVIATHAMGWWLTHHDDDWVLSGVLTTTAIAGIALATVPQSVLGRESSSSTAMNSAAELGRASWAWMRRSGLPLVALTAMFLNCSHAALYGYGSVTWRSAGLSESRIGWLWAEGVIVEIVVFAFVGPWLARGIPEEGFPARWRFAWLHRRGGAGIVLSRWLALRSETSETRRADAEQLAPERRPQLHALRRASLLLILAAFAGIVRWTLFANKQDFSLLIAGQVLHGLTFAAMHLGILQWVQELVAPERMPTAMTMVNALAFGLGMGLAFPLLGQLYPEWGTQVFYVMAAFSFCGLLCAWGLLRRAGRIYSVKSESIAAELESTEKS